MNTKYCFLKFLNEGGVQMKLLIVILLVSVSVPAWTAGALFSREETVSEIQKMNRMALQKKAPLSDELVAVLKKECRFQSKKIMISTQEIEPDLVRAIFCYLPSEKTLGVRRFRNGKAVFSNCALYLIGDNTLKRALKIGHVEPLSETDLEAGFGEYFEFYFAIPYSVMPGYVLRVNKVEGAGGLLVERHIYQFGGDLTVDINDYYIEKVIRLITSADASSML
jgi:hypothetical protein